MLSINIGRHYGDVGSGFVLQTESYLGADDGVCIGHGGEVISPVESGAQADGVGVVGADGVNDLLLEGFPLSPCADLNVSALVVLYMADV